MPEFTLRNSTQEWVLDDFESIPAELRGRTIDLIHVDDLDWLPPGVELYSIMGKRVVVGEDFISTNHRMGYLAYGLLRPEGD